jgi:hypothetical protein
MSRFPETLNPTGYESIIISPRQVINVPKATPIFSSWCGNAILDNYNGKQVLNVGGEPAFAELAILWAMRAVGWEGVWIDTYGRKYRTGYWGVTPLSELPPERTQLLERIYTRAGSRSGAWDVYCWSGSKVLFAESKRAGRDKIRDSQRHWLAAAIEEGYPKENFLVVEWSIKKGPNNTE